MNFFIVFVVYFFCVLFYFSGCVGVEEVQQGFVYSVEDVVVEDGEDEVNYGYGFQVKIGVKSVSFEVWLLFVKVFLNNNDFGFWICFNKLFSECSFNFCYGFVFVIDFILFFFCEWILWWFR